MMRIEKLPRWCPEAEAGLSQVFDRDHDDIVAGVNRGRFELFRLWDGAAYMVTLTDRRLVTVCCYQGERAIETLRWLRARCQRLGIPAIEFFTRRPALARLLAAPDAPVKLDYYVFRTEVRAA